MHLILNEPQVHQELLQQTLTQPIKPIITKQNFIILPLTEYQSSANQPSSANRHPTYLLNNFPHRPHYYPPDSVGAQAGYCLSPIPPCLRQFINSSSIPTHQISPHPCPSRTRIPHNHSTSSSDFAVSSAALSSLPSLSTTVDSSSLPSSSSSSSSISSNSLLKPAQPIPQLKNNTLAEHQSLHKFKLATQRSSSSTLGTTDQISQPELSLTKKLLPIPPSLSPRVRQIFLHKINSQQAQSCAQLPRRKKKKPVLETITPSL